MNPSYTKWLHVITPNKLGKNLGRERRTLKRQAGWKDRVPVTASPDDKDSGYIIVLVRDTSATTCYGCGGKVRTKPSDNPPPTPFDIFIKDMNCGYSKKEVTYKSLEFPRTRKLYITILMQIVQPKSMGWEMPQA